MYMLNTCSLVGIADENSAFAIVDDGRITEFAFPVVLYALEKRRKNPLDP